MPVAWVNGTGQFAASASSITVDVPNGIESGDSLLVGVFSRRTQLTPSGWTLLRTQIVATTISAPSDFVFGFSVYAKDTVTAGDSGGSFVFSTTSTGDVFALACVLRGVLSISTASASNDNFDGYRVTPASLTSGSNGSMHLILAGQITSDPAAVTPIPPAGFTLGSGGSVAFCAMASGYRASSNGQSNSGDFNLNALGASSITLGGGLNGIGAITLLLTPVDAGATATPGRIEVATPLGQPAVRSDGLLQAGLVAVPTVLGSARPIAQHDFTGFIPDGQPLRYVMDLITPGGRVRAPISSWQATLQTEQANYLQCVVPACEPFVSAINAATRFEVLRKANLSNGLPIEYVMAAAPLDTVSTAQGTINFTATLSGYSPGLALVGTPPPSTNRVLQGVRTVFTQPGGIRVRCSIDWLLRPGQFAVLDGAPFLVSYINYYVTDGDQYMDVGERVEPT